MAKLDIAKLAGRLGELNKPRGGNGEGSGERMSFLQITDGLNTLRILPPKGNADNFAQEVWVHYGVGKSETNSKGTMVVCPKTHDENAYCPVCELSSQFRKMSKKKDDKMYKESRELYRKKRVYYNAINRADDPDNYEMREEDGKQVSYNKETDEPETYVKVLGTGIGVYKDLLGFICDPDYGDITDPDEGLDVKITKSGSGQFNTNYEVKTARKESPIGIDDWEEQAYDLSTLAKCKTVEELEALISGEEPPKSSKKDDEEEDDGKPVDISEDPRKASKPVKEEEEDAGGEEDGDDIQSEIQAALARRKGGK